MNNTIGIVSGYFDPVHLGHIEYINAAKELCDYLICIVNNDYQVHLKKSQKFMDQEHRLKIIENLKSVNEGIISIDHDSSVTMTIDFLYKKFCNKYNKIIFFNSGDRPHNNQNSSEINICNKHNIDLVYINLPKIYSSSELKRNFSS